MSPPFKNRFCLRILPVCLFVLSLFCLAPAGPAFAVPFIDKETEISMGQKADVQVVAQYGLYQDKELQLYVNELGQKLVGNLSNPEFSRYFFKVVDSAEINAFALPGGYIYVTRGILAMINSEAELAGVLGHEIGHVTQHHGAKQVIRSIGAQILSIGGAIASPKNAGEWLMVSTQLFNTINLGYGREAELESDAHGLMIAQKSGYHPKAMVDFLSNLRQQEILTGQVYHSFQATHPETKERIIKAGTLSQSIYNRNKGTLKDNREGYLKKIQGMEYGGSSHKGDRRDYDKEYIDIYKVKPGDTFQSIAVKELEDEKKDWDIAILNGRRMDSKPVPGEYLKLVRKGVPASRKILELKPEKF
ncbi:M48 family metallopeptidase [Nitrospina watsonii]|uniref:Peptidase_M48 domain-containing protein n=1 Tax=Nitrospina watsonii TaxID=1323948 RepID=A0ABN8W2X7_9BACT|nr:M48 family metallopeptidase [Nitrospina watsonii]CAI2718378.1 Peptidase_M48 domain-containing protein [Nitrospina watsonii]